MKITMLITTTFFANFAIAQSFESSYSKLSVGAGINANIYQGDITKRAIGSVETIKPGIHLWGSYAFSNQFSAQITAGVLRLKGDDTKYNNPSYHRLRNFNFTATVKELEAKVRYNIFKNNSQDYRLLFPYIGTGIGFGFYNIKNDASGLSSKLSSAEPWIVQGLIEDAVHGTPKFLIFVPITVGVKKYFTPRIDLYAEANYKWINTDYLDGFSKSAGANNKDKYYAISVGAIYKFYKKNADKMGCPKW